MHYYDLSLDIQRRLNMEKVNNKTNVPQRCVWRGFDITSGWRFWDALTFCLNGLRADKGY
jgi:hypothetical protein